MTRVAAQARVELVLTLRRGESLLVTAGIPVLVLVFFSLVDVLPHGRGRAVDFLVPGVLALSVIASALTSLSIATGFERHAGVLRLIGATPLGRGGLFVAKVTALVGVLALQVVAVSVVGLGLGWAPNPTPVAAAVFAGGVVAFAGIGFAAAGRLRAETNLAVANALFLLFLFLGGVVVPVSSLPEGFQALAHLLPAQPLASGLRASLGGVAVETRDAVTLGVWAVLGLVGGWRWFRWD